MPDDGRSSHTYIHTRTYMYSYVHVMLREWISVVNQQPTTTYRRSGVDRAQLLTCLWSFGVRSIYANQPSGNIQSNNLHLYFTVFQYYNTGILHSKLNFRKPLIGSLSRFIGNNNSNMALWKSTYKSMLWLFSVSHWITTSTTLYQSILMLHE